MRWRSKLRCRIEHAADPTTEHPREARDDVQHVIPSERDAGRRARNWKIRSDSPRSRSGETRFSTHIARACLPLGTGASLSFGRTVFGPAHVIVSERPDSLPRPRRRQESITIRPVVGTDSISWWCARSAWILRHLDVHLVVRERLGAGRPAPRGQCITAFATGWPVARPVASRIAWNRSVFSESSASCLSPLPSSMSGSPAMPMRSPTDVVS